LPRDAESDKDYEIRWYRYKLGENASDNYSGLSYKRIDPRDGLFVTLITKEDGQ
jgi:hypothetical protein